MKQDILIIGSGGREHALAWKLAQSPRAEKIYVAPGNGGTSQVAENVSISVSDFSALVKFAQDHAIDITVVGPDEPLAAGIVDSFQAAGLRIWGPSQAAARIESSKSFAKSIQVKNNIPTAHFTTFTNYAEAREYVRNQPRPIVIKADGLALGKGVFICHSMEEADLALEQIMVKRIFGAAGERVIVEEFMKGQEISIHAFSDGTSYKMFPSSQDHKAAHDGDLGPNTGGMGSIAPVPWVNKYLLDMVESSIVKLALDGLRNEGSPFIGCLYPGLMITPNGPRVVEFNSRFGDPEAQSYMRLLKTDLLDIIDACIDGTLGQLEIEWHPCYAACVVVSSGGYPGAYEKGFLINGLKEAEAMDNVEIFHAGTVCEGKNYYTSAGRVLGVTATGATLQEALDLAYAAIEKISFDHMYFRSDIGRKALKGLT